MRRRELVKLGTLAALANRAFPQGREFRKNPPPAKPESTRIIDLHVHTFFKEKAADKAVFSPQLNNSRSDGVYQMNASWEQFQHDMQPVHKACVLHVAQDVGRRGNDFNAALAKRWPEKIIPFGSVNPNHPEALDEFRRGVKQLGLKGFKLSPIYQSFHPMDPGACRIYAQAQEWNIPLIFHAATAQAANVPLKYANPVLFDEVAYSFPKLKIIMAHMGHPWQRECIVMMRKHPNVYTELSGTIYRPWDFYQSMMLAVEWGQTHKILFGTDWPIVTAQETIDGIRRVNQFAKAGLPRIPEELLEGIIYRDSLALLGIG